MEMETEYLLNIAIDIATTEFESFCAQRFSLSSLVKSKLLKTATALVQFRMELVAGDGYEDARIEFKPAPGGQCIFDFNPSDTRSGSVLEDRGLAIAEMIFCDFVIYLSQRGYLQDDANRAHEGRKPLMTELRELDAKLPEYVSGLRARHEAERGLLPADKEPLSQVYTGLTTLRQRLEQGNLDELVDTLKWYLDAYSEFPQLVARRRMPRNKLKGTLQVGAPVPTAQKSL